MSAVDQLTRIIDTPFSQTIPARYADATFDGYEPRTPSQAKAKALMQRLVLWNSQHDDVDTVDLTVTDSAVLIGPPGVGKSHLAAAACRALFSRQYANRAALFAPQWINLPSLIVDLRAEMSAPRDEQDRTSLARRVRSFEGLVVLDDLGREKVSDWTGELVYTIVNDRYERQLPTIATSNLSPEELTAAGYWPAISRLAEGGEIVVMEGPDHRLVKS